MTLPGHGQEPVSADADLGLCQGMEDCRRLLEHTSIARLSEPEAMREAEALHSLLDAMLASAARHRATGGRL